MTEGLKSETLLFEIYFLRKSLRLALTRPTSLYKGGCFPQKDGQRVRVSCPFCNIQKKGTGENPDTFPGAEGETRRVFNPSCSLCEQFILCPFLLRKKMDEEFESPALFAIYRKKVPGKIPIPFLAQKERLDGFSTRRVRFANSLFYVPFCSAKRWTKSSSLLPFLQYTEKRYRGKSRYLSWRRRRDSNSRAGYPTYALSRGASSPT